MDHIDHREGRHNPCETVTWPLAGAVGWPEAAAHLDERGSRLGLDSGTLAHLGTSYGALAEDVLDLVERDATSTARIVPDLPAIIAEVDYTVQAELALTLEDVMSRRLRLSLEALDHGRGVAPAVAERMATLLGWDAVTRESQIDAYRAAMEMHDSGLQREAQTSEAIR